MDTYIDTTKAILTILQNAMSNEELERSEEMADALYGEYQKLSEKKQLNLREMANAIIAVNLTVTEKIQEELKKISKETEDQINEKP